MLGCANVIAAPLGERFTGDLFVHDPSTVVEQQGEWFLFSTGPGIATKQSTNGLEWRRAAPVFASPPEWTTNSIPGFRGYFWAPDVVFAGGKYHLYYSVSTFGKQRSAIGVVSTPTLNRASPEFKWTDAGAVIESSPGDPFNAIDPSVLLDGDGRLWLAFGSFWRGIYLAELNPRTGKRVDTRTPPRQLAWHESIEAPTLHRRGQDYFLFVNWGMCCRGTNSTYEVRVGRSKSITGPYRDREGRRMLDGGGTPFLGTDGADIGPGHVTVFNRGGQEFICYHVYDRERGGRSQLRLKALRWTDDGWPSVGR